MNRPPIVTLLLVVMLSLTAVATGQGQEARILVRADRAGPGVSRHMTGVCIEDVNHEIYGGISSQMVFGESFQEPPATAIEGFTAYGGDWATEGEAEGGVVRSLAGDGPRLVAKGPPLGTGAVSVQVRFPDVTPGRAGLILKVNNSGADASRFTGYEVALDPGRQHLVFGRHRGNGNWEPIRDVPCAVPVGPWIDLSVRMTDTRVQVRVDDRSILEFEDRERPLLAGAIGLRASRPEAAFRGLTITRGATREARAFRAVNPHGPGGISGMWQAVRRGSAAGRHALEAERPFAGAQSQRITFASGDGAIGVANRGLNRWGMNFVAGKSYEGYLWIRADAPAEVHVAAESHDGARTLAEAVLTARGPEWQRYDFTLTPAEADEAGRLAVTLRRPGSVVLGHAFLQPGPWGRFRGLPTRRDVAEELIRQGVTVMRLGGLMVNADGYRWKNMIGPRDRRPPCKGYWYPHSSNGWGIFDFLDLCEAAGFLPVVDLNMDETPQDLADFVAYTNGPVSSEWGSRRARDGHPEPYRLKYLELGNEEAVDEAYCQKFKPLAEAIWAADPQIVPIVGDFEYRRPITDPDRVEGAPRIKSLGAHKKILDLARTHGREVWFDVHIWNHNPRDAQGRFAALASFDAALARLSPGADYRLCVLEENATNHAVRRAVAHGETVGGLMRLGDRVRIVCAANALQPDGQNDNGWDQGLLFLNPSKAWLQPPGYVTQMIARNYQPQVVDASVTGADTDLDVTATLSADRTTLILQVANLGAQPRSSRIDLEGFAASKPVARLEELVGPLDAKNPAEDPARIQPRQAEWRHASADGVARYTFPPYSFTILRFE
jgi:alpha-L-arabinofuranosidase